MTIGAEDPAFAGGSYVIVQKYLHDMAVGDPPGNYDRILDFSTAVTGTLFFVPTADFLDDAPPLPSEASGATNPGGDRAVGPEGTLPSGPAAGDGSLGIGGFGGRS